MISEYWTLNTAKARAVYLCACHLQLKLLPFFFPLEPFACGSYCFPFRLRLPHQIPGCEKHGTCIMYGKTDEKKGSSPFQNHYSRMILAKNIFEIHCFINQPYKIQHLKNVFIKENSYFVFK